MSGRKRFSYTGAKTREISFPLGGIGTGCIGLAGYGGLIDWEIANRPDKGMYNGYSHFAVKAEKDGKLCDARVLHGDVRKDFSGQHLRDPENAHHGFGYGIESFSMAGFPHFEHNELIGEFPIAEVRFADPHFPGRVTLTAFNPFIPLNDKDSSLPAAFFEIAFENDTAEAYDYTAAFSVRNFFESACRNRHTADGGLSLIQLGQTTRAQGDPAFGDLCIATDDQDAQYQEYWYRGGWFDSVGIYWQNFIKNERFENRRYDTDGGYDTATLAVRRHVPAGGRAKVRFVVAWNFPNQYNYWYPCKQQTPEGEKDVTWKNYYATLFGDSAETARYCLAQFDRLYTQTDAFREALFSSTLPDCVLDAASANLSVLKSPTVMRLEDGSFYAWEGVSERFGSCEGSCTHVWNYAYALPYLFPKLERSMRDLDYGYSQDRDGRMVFRLGLPLGRELSNFRACVDGQMGGVIKAYRDWKLCGDDAWLRKNWPMIKKSIEYAWSPSNADRWDRDKDGILEGRQHQTLDMELFGPSSWLEGFYLGALKAGAEMAEAMGEPETAAEYRALYENGRKWMNEALFNGRYYYHKVDLEDRAVLEAYLESDPHILEGYWNEEAGEIKYQVGEGSSIDQAVAQWHANLCGLGEIYDKKKLHAALEAIYQGNFKRCMRECYNPCRVFCLNEEAGTVICDYPEGARRPVVSVPYCEETMHGFEYSAAALLISEGMVEQGLEMVKAVRDRYDGEKRNPWNEFECGSNYARSMASFSLLPIFSGFTYDLRKGVIGFHPLVQQDCYRCMWSLDPAWGTVEIHKDGLVILSILGGRLPLKTLSLPFLTGVQSVMVDGQTAPAAFAEGSISFDITAAKEIRVEGIVG